MFEAEIKYLADTDFTAPPPASDPVVYDDAYFDTPDGAFYASGQELRLRTVAGKTLLTYKRPAFDTATGSKEELETAVADPAVMASILEGLGYVLRLSYAKTCRCSRLEHAGLILNITEARVDFSPQTFVEIEHMAPDEPAALAALPVIRAVAARLGLRRECPAAYTDLCLAALARNKDRP